MALDWLQFPLSDDLQSSHVIKVIETASELGGTSTLLSLPGFEGCTRFFIDAGSSAEILPIMPNMRVSFLSDDVLSCLTALPVLPQTAIWQPPGMVGTIRFKISADNSTVQLIRNELDGESYGDKICFPSYIYYCNIQITKDHWPLIINRLNQTKVVYTNTTTSQRTILEKEMSTPSLNPISDNLWKKISLFISGEAEFFVEKTDVVAEICTMTSASASTSFGSALTTSPLELFVVCSNITQKVFDDKDSENIRSNPIRMMTHYPIPLSNLYTIAKNLADAGKSAIWDLLKDGTNGHHQQHILADLTPNSATMQHRLVTSNWFMFRFGITSFLDSGHTYRIPTEHRKRGPHCAPPYATSYLLEINDNQNVLIENVEFPDSGIAFVKSTQANISVSVKEKVSPFSVLDSYIRDSGVTPTQSHSITYLSEPLVIHDLVHDSKVGTYNIISFGYSTETGPHQAEFVKRAEHMGLSPSTTKIGLAPKGHSCPHPDTVEQILRSNFNWLYISGHFNGREYFGTLDTKVGGSVFLYANYAVIDHSKYSDGGWDIPLGEYEPPDPTQIQFVTNNLALGGDSPSYSETCTLIDGKKDVPSKYSIGELLNFSDESGSLGDYIVRGKSIKPNNPNQPDELYLDKISDSQDSPHAPHYEKFHDYKSTQSLGWGPNLPINNVIYPQGHFHLNISALTQYANRLTIKRCVYIPRSDITLDGPTVFCAFGCETFERWTHDPTHSTKLPLAALFPHLHPFHRSATFLSDNSGNLPLIFGSCNRINMLITHKHISSVGGRSWMDLPVEQYIPQQSISTPLSDMEKGIDARKHFFTTCVEKDVRYQVNFWTNSDGTKGTDWIGGQQRSKDECWIYPAAAMTRDEDIRFIPKVPENHPIPSSTDQDYPLHGKLVGTLTKGIVDANLWGRW